MKMNQVPYLILLCVLCCATLPLAAQGDCVGSNGVVLYNVNHPTAYADLTYKNAVAIDEITPAINVNLGLRVYYPTDLGVNERRPLVVLIHGGFFIAGGYGDFAALAQELAQIGFIAATIDYRLCQRGDCLVAGATTYPCGVSWGNSLLPSAYVAMIDAADAIRYLQNQAATYHIDPNNVIIGGHSAGALTTLHLAYLDADEVATVCEGCGTWPDYLSEPIVPLTGIKAIVPMSGAIYDLNWIDADEANIAVALIHGTNDGTVPYDHDELIECCSGTPFPSGYGACPIAERLATLGANYELITGNGCTHDIYSSGFFNEVKEEVAAFLIKTVLCNTTAVQRHILFELPNPEAVCPPFPLYSATGATTCNLPLSTPYSISVGMETVSPQSLGWEVEPTLVKETLHLQHQLSLGNESYSLQIVDVYGHVVFQQNAIDLLPFMTVSTAQWSNGMYFVQLIDTNKRLRAIQKIVKLSH